MTISTSQEHFLKKVQYRVQKTLSYECLYTGWEFECFWDYAARSLVLQLTTSLAEQKTSYETKPVYRPENWWEAVKERFLPLWARKKWPIKMETISTEIANLTKLCPHLKSHDQDCYRFFTFEAPLFKETYA